MKNNSDKRVIKQIILKEKGKENLQFKWQEQKLNQFIKYKLLSTAENDTDSTQKMICLFVGNTGTSEKGKTGKDVTDKALSYSSQHCFYPTKFTILGPCFFFDFP
jgi:hypothetical protein